MKPLQDVPYDPLRLSDYFLLDGLTHILFSMIPCSFIFFDLLSKILINSFAIWNMTPLAVSSYWTMPRMRHAALAFIIRPFG